MNNRVTVVIATRNRGALLRHSVDSARRAGKKVDIIVVDDASEDQTEEICRSWVDVRYIRLSRRMGLGGARNVGLIASTSPYISFLDDDDLRLPGSLDEQVELLSAQPEAGMIYGRVLYGDEYCQPGGGFYPEQCPQGDVFWQLLRGNFIPCPSVVFRRACLTRVGLLEEEAPGIEDWDLWVRIAELYPVLALEKPVAIWRRPTGRSGQFTSRPERLHRESRRLHREKWLQLPRAVEAGSARRRESARGFFDHSSQQLLWEMAERLKARRYSEFGQVAWSAARLYPIGIARKVLRVSTWQSAMNSLEDRQSESASSVAQRE